MAKMMLLSRPNMTAALCGRLFFRCHAIRRPYQSQPQPQPGARLIQPLLTQFTAVKPLLIHTRNISSAAGATGPIDSPLMLSMETKIKEQLNAELVTVKDAYGDGRHVSIDVVSSDFEGKSAVNRQRMVYKAIWEELQSVVHAVDQMTTRTPEEAASGK
ncbi:hypothetical protein M8C21_026539 [Ambrosia artemisiifolia]|uniref:Protein BOLA4, chloroplastic/mitochondrial n=1 Tax=Ambrosia artemisiifolia TaxID=4212 RepID=A0AAD5CD70_AMBAR|nr:hypothetical protein M8C21_026539 [Ambrosia artemisiifolia]